MKYFALYPTRETNVQKLQNANLYYNPELKENETDDYSWNTTLGKIVNFPEEFWLVLDTRNLTFEYAEFSTLFLVSRIFLDLIKEYIPDEIQYVKVNLVHRNNRNMLDKEYYFIKVTVKKDWIDYENSEYLKKYDLISKRYETVKYLKIKLKEDEIDREIFMLNNNILGTMLYVSENVKDEILKRGFDKSIHIVPVDDVAQFHGEYFGLVN